MLKAPVLTLEHGPFFVCVRRRTGRHRDIDSKPLCLLHRRPYGGLHDIASEPTTPDT